MTDHPKSAREIFDQAIEIADPVQRQTFIQRACQGNEDLLGQVQDLIDENRESIPLLQSTQAAVKTEYDEYLTRPGSPTDPVIAAPVFDNPGVTISENYKLIENIGEGGMGSVWVAEQLHPVRRRVAIKMIKAGMDSKEVIARFEAERQALAMMDHPNIAKVFDGGITDQGRPWFAMELVKGIPLTEYCDQVRYSVRQRLELFGQVCLAVQHAHLKGIIHRDLKPTNVLVTEHDGRPVVKVIDFGLAKALHGSQILTDLSMNTAFGAVVGTPLYMAPEQMSASALDVDTRADLYSLGVILYELLTGTTPIEHRQLKEAAWDEMCRLLREEEPPRPSTRLSSSDTLPSLAALRHVEPAKLTRSVRGELDWIIMKLLEKDRNRRYETANSLGLDIQRYLEGEPILAAPPSRVYKLQKFVRRNRSAVLAASILLLTLLGGLAGTLYGLRQAQAAAAKETVARSDAEAKQKLAETERERAEIQRRLAETLRERAENREQAAIDAVKGFGDAVANNPMLKNSPQLESLRITLLKEPLAFFTSLRELLQSELDTRPESLAHLADAATDLARLTSEIGNQQDALQAYREALTIQKQLVRNNPSINDYQFYLAGSHHSIGSLLSETGEPIEALASYERALAIQEQLARENPAVTKYQKDLALFHNSIGILYGNTGLLTQALVSHKRALAIQIQLAREYPTVSQYQYDLAISHNNLGTLFLETGKLDQALASYERALAIQEQLARDNPTVTDFQKLLAGIHNNLGKFFGDTGKPSLALASFERALTISEQLSRDNPTVTEYQNFVATYHKNIGLMLSQTGKPTEALASHERALIINEQLARDHPGVTGHRNLLAETHVSIGILLSKIGKPVEALASFDRSLAIQEHLVRENPKRTAYLNTLARIHNNIGALMIDAGKQTEALTAFERALIIQKQLARDNPAVPENLVQLGAALNNMATIDLLAGRFAVARDQLLEAIEWQKKALDRNPGNPTARQLLLHNYNNLRKAAQGLNDSDLTEVARKGLAGLDASDPQYAELDQRMAAILAGEPAKDANELLALADRAYDLGRFIQSTKLFGKAIEQDDTLVDSRETQHAYNAACSAALAGCGEAIDDPDSEHVNADGTQQQALRAQALAWLTTELERWNKHLNDAPDQRQRVVMTLAHWQQDTDLAGIRDDEALAKLSEEERNGLESFWKQVRELADRTTDQKND